MYLPRHVNSRIPWIRSDHCCQKAMPNVAPDRHARILPHSNGPGDLTGQLRVIGKGVTSQQLPLARSMKYNLHQTTDSFVSDGRQYWHILFETVVMVKQCPPFHRF